jgi:hypothetical protein
MHLLDGHKENIRYWNLKDKALGRPCWTTRYGPVARQYSERKTNKTSEVSCTICVLSRNPL